MNRREPGDKKQPVILAVRKCREDRISGVQELRGALPEAGALRGVSQLLLEPLRDA